MDFVGPFHPPSNQKAYILVAMDYVTKWVETIDLARATEEAVIKFLFGLFVLYGLSREVIIDGGKQFTGHKITATLRSHDITCRITSLYHPQANRQVESTNKVIEAILTKIVSTHRQYWSARLLEALCAYRMTWRNITRHSPYHLVFGKEPIFQIKFEINNLRKAKEVGLDLTEAQTKHLQEINELDEA